MSTPPLTCECWLASLRFLSLLCWGRPSPSLCSRTLVLLVLLRPFRDWGVTGPEGQGAGGAPSTGLGGQQVQTKKHMVMRFNLNYP